MLADLYRQNQVHIALEQRDQLLARRDANLADDSPARAHHHLLELHNDAKQNQLCIGNAKHYFASNSCLGLLLAPR